MKQAWILGFGTKWSKVPCPSGRRGILPPRLTPDDRLVLKDYANSDLGVSRNARSILNFLDRQFPLYGAEPYRFTRTAIAETQESLTIDDTARQLQVFPNPTNGQFIVTINESMVTPSTTLEIYTADGRLIKTIPVPSGNGKVEVSISEMQPGIYFVSLIVDGILESAEKVVKY